jgi:hypothetical protein
MRLPHVDRVMNREGMLVERRKRRQRYGPLEKTALDGLDVPGLCGPAWALIRDRRSRSKRRDDMERLLRATALMAHTRARPVLTPR